MSRWDRHLQRREMQREAESAGQVADSMDVRKALMARVHTGEITLAEAQTELKKIKRAAKGAGQVTRAQAYRGLLKSARGNQS